MIRRLAAAALAVLVTAGPAPAGQATMTVLGFDDLDGWAADDHAAALATFLTTCGDMDGADWQAVCRFAKSEPEPRTFFELFFRPVLIEDGTPGLLTGYFEPEIDGARVRGGAYQFPVYRRPPDLVDGVLWHSRADIETQGLLDNRGLEIAWVRDPVELFFMQVQGSGRIRLTDGSTIRLGYGGANGHPYVSIGEELVRRGIYSPHQVSAQVIANWVRRNPEAGRELLQTNPSYVFFRVIEGVDAALGPLGAMNRPLTPDRSLAVDRRFIPLGAPVWVEKGGPEGFRRLMVAQDTGSAITGAQRGDIFYGTGEAAGRRAGRVRDPGRLIVLMPIEVAYAMAEGTVE